MKKTRIMWIEHKGTDGIVGPARIGRVTFSKSGQSLYYGGKHFQKLGGYESFKANYYDVESGDNYWISGCHKDGRDALYNTDVEIDDDVREEYWRDIRSMPEMSAVSSFRAKGKYRS
jgi:hypothetical protein